MVNAIVSKTDDFETARGPGSGARLPRNHWDNGAEQSRQMPMHMPLDLRRECRNGDHDKLALSAVDFRFDPNS